MIKKIFIVVLLLLFSLPALAQRTNSQTTSRIRDGQTATRFLDLSQFNLSFNTTTIGLYSLAAGYFYEPTGANFVVTNGVTTQADGLALTLNGLVVTSVLYGSNGATLDMMKMSATDGMIVNVEDWPSAFDEGNGEVKTHKNSIEGYTPPVEQTAAIGAAATTVIASKEIIGYPNITIYLENTDGADPFTDADVEVSPDDSTWIDLSWAACDALAAGSACVYQLTNSSYRYIRVRVTGAAGNEVSVDAWITANVN